MSDTLIIFGREYDDVTGIKATDDQDNTITYTSGGGGITPSGTISITANDTYDVTQYASADVNVPSGGGSTPEVTVTTSGAVTQELQPDTVYHFTSTALTSLTITLASASGTPTYHFDFISPSTAVTLTLPASVTMPNNFTVEVNTRYEIDICNGYGVFAEWAYQEVSS